MPAPVMLEMGLLLLWLEMVLRAEKCDGVLGHAVVVWLPFYMHNYLSSCDWLC